MSGPCKPGSANDKVPGVKTDRIVTRGVKRAQSSQDIKVPAIAVRCAKSRESPHFKKNDISLSADKPEDLADQLPDTTSELALLKQQRKAHQAAARTAAYEVKKAEQKRRRLEAKASKMSNSDLLTVYMARQKRCKAAEGAAAKVRPAAASTDSAEEEDK